MTITQYYADLPQNLYQLISPEPISSPELLVFNKELEEQLCLPLEFQKKDAEFLAGNKQVEHCKPLALGYTGHQFGQLNAQLGDGRAHLLGQVFDSSNAFFDLQLKGSGRTRYSRGGDGRSTLKAALREYIVSEYVHKLNIPTSRSLYVIKSSDKIMRDELVDSGIVCRVAKTHLRIGSFQFAAMHQDKHTIKALADFAIKHYYPNCLQSNTPYLALFETVLKKSSDLVAHWMSEGFIHGVMNTDNILISGETIDFGPCAFMGKYDPVQCFSSIDRQGRYAYQNQPGIMHWNLARFAESLISLVDEDENKSIELLSASLNQFKALYDSSYTQRMALKLGLNLDNTEDNTFQIQSLLTILKSSDWQYTSVFSFLHSLASEEKQYHPIESTHWYENWLETRHITWKQSVINNNKASYLSNSDIETLLDECVENPHNSERLIASYFDELNRASSSLLSKNQLDFDKGYKTFCGT